MSKILELNKIGQVLFKHTEFLPQMGSAREDKTALIWSPGKKAHNPSYAAIKLDSGKYLGYTQLAFEDCYASTVGAKCDVCWFGLDIDADDNTHIDLLLWGLSFGRQNAATIIRTSCSGKGLHLMWVLAKPIRTNNETAGRVVKQLALPMKQLAESQGIHVCQANRRMFWLVGGHNYTMWMDESNLHEAPVESVVDTVVKDNLHGMELSDTIKGWVRFFKEKNVVGSVREKNPIYIGDAVEALRGIGEVVKTCSGCSGNGQVNGYLDIEPNKISLWSYADGHNIWVYQDIKSLLGGF